MNIIYRKILPSESKLYREIRLESLKVNPERFYTKYEDEKKKEVLSFERDILLELSEKFVIGAFSNTKLVGICSFYQIPKGNNKGGIVQMFVQPLFRKNNIGLGLVNKVVNTAFKLKGINTIELDVMELKNDALKDFYIKAGFNVYNQKTVELNGESFEFIQMSLSK